MPADDTLPPTEPPRHEEQRQPDRITEYARRGRRELAVVIAATVGVVVIIQLVLHEVIGDRGDLQETVLRGLVTSLAPILFLLITVRRRP